MNFFPRTVSQLPAAAALNEKSLFEVSEYNDSNAYISKNCSYGKLSACMNNDISASMTRQYNLSKVETAYKDNTIQLSNIVTKVKNLYADDVKITGTKTFTTPIETTNTYSATADVLIPNLKNVKDLMSNAGSYISSSYVSPSPFDDNGFAHHASNDDAETSYVRMDFTLANLRETKSAKVGETGYLTLYGWLADNGNVPAELAWVRLEAKLIVDGAKAWVPIQVLPWILGTQSRVLQYVGFNAYVHEDLELKVTTGFDVNLNNGAFSTIGSMTYDNAAAAHCGFFGYIIKVK